MWVGAAVGAASLVSGIIGSKNAAKKQDQANQQALAAQQAATQQIRTDNLPALQARNNGLMLLQQKAGQYGMAPTSEQVMAQPGYQFGLQQGNNNLQNAAAANGGLYSGAVGKALSRYGTDYATTKYGQAFDQMQTAQNNDFGRYQAITQDGQNGANLIAGQTANLGSSTAGLLTNNANNQGAATIAQSNLLSNGLNQLGSWANSDDGRSTIGRVKSDWFGPASNGSAGYQNGSDLGWDINAPLYKAEGGPVRAEPVIGSRTPLPQGGTGGGLDRNALLQLLAMQQARQQVQQPQMRANFLTRPGQILDMQLNQAGAYEHGGAVHGPGGPTDDEIPAMLSNDEFVMTQRAVKGAGGGNVDKGHTQMNKLMALLEKKGGR